jgi:hypothetical protein
VKYHDRERQYQGEFSKKNREIVTILSLRFSGNSGCSARQTPENRGNPKNPGLAAVDFTPNMG